MALALGVFIGLAGGCAAPITTSTLPSATPVSCAREVFNRGGGWYEIGGPRAFVEEYPYVASKFAARLTVRFTEPTQQPLGIQARLIGGGFQERGTVQNAIRREDWAEGKGPPANLAGTVHLAILRLPRPGCWELTLTAGSEIVGIARLEVRPA